MDAALLDAHPPEEIARRVERVGVKKAEAGPLQIGLLAVLAGAFIAMGAIFFVVVTTGSALGFGVTRLLGGVVFSLGLILVVVGGAELFTGNNLVAMAWALPARVDEGARAQLVLAYVGNALGAVGTVVLVHASGIAALADGAVGETALRIGAAKVGLSPLEAFARGILCNALVCMAVWLAMGARTVADKVLVILFPISAFVAAGFEHCVANWFFLPYALVLGDPVTLPLSGVLSNLFFVTIGNVVGGTLLVAGIYWLAYLQPNR